MVVKVQFYVASERVVTFIFCFPKPQLSPSQQEQKSCPPVNMNAEAAQPTDNILS